jgi:hypothetical protein
VKHPSVAFLAASPDGISMQTGTMLEIKCPSMRPVTNIPPLWYWIQMQAQMECCGLDICDFFDCEFVKYLFYDEWKVDALKEEPDDFHRFGIAINTGKNVYEYAPVSVVRVEEFESWASTYDEAT